MLVLINNILQIARAEYECAPPPDDKIFAFCAHLPLPAAYYIAMYELKLARPSFYRVKRGQTAKDISAAFGCPVPEDVAEGDIIELPRGNFFTYSARVGDSYSSIAAKFGVGEAELKELNGGKPVYPTCRICIPMAGGGAE